LANRTVFDVRRQYIKSKLTGGHLWRRLATRASGQLYLDRGSDPADSVFLAGTARAGTTWISELINYRNDYRYIFEPFHPNRLPMTKHFLPRQYLRPSDRDPAYLRPAEIILSGRIRSLWTDKYNKKRFVSRRLLKEVRGNLLLGWLHRNFPDTPMVLILRHPCAVASSQVDLANQAWKWHLDLPGLLSQPALAEDFLEPFADELMKPRSKFEQHVFLWCVENYVPLKQLGSGKVHLAFYEDFCVSPATEIQRLFAFLGMEFDEDVLERVGRPSAVARKNSAIMLGESLVERWRRDVTDEDLGRALEILALFGLDRVYGEGSMPKLKTPSEAFAHA
jgi:hypothetical protein